jgi:hypothetical protein
LKEIRQEIARANDISLVTSECRYQGDCAGTCPKCEAEVAYLEQQLNLRRMAGKTVMLTGLAAGALMLGSCHGGGEKTTSATTSSTESAMKTAGAVDMDPENAGKSPSVFRAILGLEDGEEIGQWQGEVSPDGHDLNEDGNTVPERLEGEVPYIPDEDEEQKGA